MNLFYYDLCDEFNFVREFLLNNGYKNNIIERCIKIFLNNRNNGKSLHSYPPKLKLYFKLPFYGDKSFEIRKELNKIINKYYPQVNICIVFTNGKKLCNYFKFKDSVSDSLMSSLIYQFNCNRCESVYMGKTTRHLVVHISEHIGISYRTILPLTSPPFSAIFYCKTGKNEEYFTFYRRGLCTVY